MKNQFGLFQKLLQHRIVLRLVDSTIQFWESSLHRLIFFILKDMFHLPKLVYIYPVLRLNFKSEIFIIYFDVQMSGTWCQIVQHETFQYLDKKKLTQQDNVKNWLVRLTCHFMNIYICIFIQSILVNLNFQLRL